MPARALALLYARDEAGNTIPGALVEVRQVDTTTKITETIYQDDDPDVDTYANPFTADSDGRIEFYLAAPKRVDLWITKSGTTSQTVRVDAMAINAATITVQDEGTPLTQRTAVNFIGGGVTAVDNAGASRTDVTIPAITVQDEGTPQAARSNVNFIGAGVSSADDAGNNRTNVTIPGVAVQNEGSLLTQRNTHNYVGDSVTASDDGANSKTQVTINHLSTAVHTVAQPAISFISDFSRQDLAASTTASQLSRAVAGGTVGATIPIVMTHPGSIVGVSVGADQARTAGTATFEVYKNGAATGLTCVLNGTDTQYAQASQAGGLDTFVAGDRLDIRVTTSADFAPNITLDVIASLTVLI